MNNILKKELKLFKFFTRNSKRNSNDLSSFQTVDKAPSCEGAFLVS